MPSIEEYRLLVRRSRMFLEEARDALARGRYDVAVFLAEQALQLHLRAQLLLVLGDYPRTHSVRQLLTALARSLGGGAERAVAEFVRRERPRLSELEDVYVASRYGLRVYTEEDAADILGTVEEVMRLAEDLVRRYARAGAGEEEAAGQVEGAGQEGG